jgi:DNA-binding NtrC family response regulator
MEHRQRGEMRVKARNQSFVPKTPAVSTMPRVVLCDVGSSENGELYESLAGLGYELVDCHDGEALLEAVVDRTPDVVVFAMRADHVSDMAVLQLLRRILPDGPLILLVRDGSLATRRTVQSLRPMYYAVAPVEGGELREAVRAAIVHRRRAH